MLMVGSYSKDYVEACLAKVVAQLASYRKVLAAPLENRRLRAPVLQPHDPGA
jgi:hypothetical protein